MADSEPPPRTALPQRRDLTTGPITRTLIAFTLPTLGSNLLQSLNGSINAIWVGNILGENALAATSNANMIMFLMFAALFGFGMAATILIGQAYGRRDIDTVRRIVGTATGLFLAMSIVVALIGYVETPALLRLLATPPQAMPLALAYLRVVFLFMPASFMMTLAMMSLRGTGDSITPMIWMAVAAVIDVGMNPVLMLGLGPFPRMGIAGAATATLVANYTTTLGMVAHIYLRDMPIRLKGRELRYIVPDTALLRTIVVKGVPMSIQMFVVSLSALVMIGLINREGVVTTAAYGVTSTLWTYISMPAMAVGAGVSAMTAQNIGANRWDRVALITRSGVIFSAAMTTLLVVLLTLVDRRALGLFLSPNSPAIPIAQHIQRLATWNFILFGVTFTLFGTMRANGAVWPALIILTVTLIPVRLGMAALMRPVLGVDAIWYSFPASSIVTMTLAVLYYRYGGWRQARMSVGAPAPVAA